MKVKKIKIELSTRDKEEIDFYRSLAILGQAVYDKRQALRLTQKDLAKSCNTTQRIISNIENAELNIGIKLLFKILRFLKLDLKLDESSLFNFNKNRNLKNKEGIEVANLRAELKYNLNCK